MLPSLLARDIQTGLKQFLVSGFEPADGSPLGTALIVVLLLRQRRVFGT